MLKCSLTHLVFSVFCSIYYSLTDASWANLPNEIFLLDLCLRIYFWRLKPRELDELKVVLEDRPTNGIWNLVVHWPEGSKDSFLVESEMEKPLGVLEHRKTLACRGLR